MVSRRVLALVIASLFIAASSTPVPAQIASPVPQSLFAEMKWRAIGPNRGGRTKAAAGHASQPYTFYIGVCNGGVWKTTDAGRTWQPIFDDQETGSIGAVVVAPSDPNIVYVGSGEGLARPDLSVGDGMFKSVDAGKTWTHIGLRDAQQIPNIAVDPRNADRLFVAVAGHPYGPSKERGIYRSTDGGRTWAAVLQKDENVGGADVDIDPSNPNVVYATMWEERQGPWENAQWRGTGAGIFKSTDGGNTWRQLKTGLPGEGNITQANLAIAPSNPRRLYAAIAAGAGTSFYKSDDSGETWTAANNRGVGRIGGGDLSVPAVDPKNADIIYTANTVSYKSTDAGQTWVPFKGAPGGDDYQNVWINPNDTNIILLAADQGAVVTVNGGKSWSSWYNQPTAQLYHVNADNDFPYRVCSGQQESGSACVSSRGNDGQITFRDWHPANGVVEYGYAVPDPLNPNIVYGSGVTRFDRTTAQFSSIGPGGGRGGGGGRAGGGGAPTGPAQRTTRTVPLAFSEADPKALYFGGGMIWKTTNGGHDWTAISPNFSRKTWDPPKTIGKYAATTPPPQQLAAVYAIAPSPLNPLRLWAGTDDGMIQTTADGGAHWADVTPPTMTPFMKVFNMDAGHFDALTAYAAGNTLRTDDMRPHLFRTHDGGKTWTEINTGLENAGPTSTIREDPKKKGLLYAGSERHVWVSFDDGDHWQTLKLNMASSSVRDLTVKDDDLIAATHGRGFWILDDVTPLRQISATSAGQDAILFKPTTALRVRWNTNSDTPLPPDEGNLQNPPEGVTLNYYLKSAASLVTLEILQTDGRLVRRYSSADPVTPIPEPTVSSLPAYWYRTPQGLSAASGMHRFPWDVHYQPLAGGAGGGRGGGLPIAAVPFNTVNPPSTPWVNPGTYTVKLTVDGKSYTQPITVKQDPRVKTSALVMQAIYADTKAAYYGAIDAQDAARQAQSLRDQIAAITPKPTGPAADTLAAFDKKLLDLIGAGGGGGGRAGGPGGGGGARGGGAGGGGRGGGAAGGGAVAAGGAPPAAAPPQAPPAAASLLCPPPAGTPVTLSCAGTALSGVMNSFQAADVAPTATQLAAMAAAKKAAAEAMAKWNIVKTIDLAAVNLKLKSAGIGPLKIQ